MFSKLKGAARAEKIRQEAVATTRDRIGEMGIRGREGGLLSKRRDVSEFVITDARWEEMRKSLKDYAGVIAKANVAELRSTGVERELPRLHKAQMITFDDGRVQVHMGAPAAQGRNIVAIPRLAESEPGVVEQKRGVDIHEFDSVAEGGGIVSNATRIGGRIGLDFIFSDEHENLREEFRGLDR